MGYLLSTILTMIFGLLSIIGIIATPSMIIFSIYEFIIEKEGIKQLMTMLGISFGIFIITSILIGITYVFIETTKNLTPKGNNRELDL